MELTKQQAIAEHRKMWNWIAEKTLERKKKVTKSHYFMEMGLSESERPFNLCYLCQYERINGHTPNCESCTIVWEEWNLRCIDSLFDKWYRLKDSEYEKAAFIAKLISLLQEMV